MPSSQIVFSADNIALARGGRMLFQNLSLTVAGGMLVELRGPNGAGKSSFLHIIMKRLAATSGNVFHNEETPAYLPPDDAILKPQETAGETLAFWAAMYGVAPVTAAAAGLDDLPCRRLSAGQRRRLNIARALLQPARLWLLDEPFNALDADAAKILREKIAAHVAAGGAAIVAGHHAPLDNALVVRFGGGA